MVQVSSNNHTFTAPGLVTGNSPPYSTLISESQMDSRFQLHVAGYRVRTEKNSVSGIPERNEINW